MKVVWWNIDVEKHARGQLVQFLTEDSRLMLLNKKQMSVNVSLNDGGDDE